MLPKVLCHVVKPLLTIVPCDGYFVHIPPVHDNHMVASAVVGQQLILAHLRDSSGVEQPPVLAHVQREGLEQVGSVPGECRRHQPTTEDGRSHGTEDRVERKPLVMGNILILQ